MSLMTGVLLESWFKAVKTNDRQGTLGVIATPVGGHRLV